MFVICTILIAVNGGGITWITKADVEGRLLKEDGDNYLVDFSQGVTKYDIKGNPEDYNKKLVKKSECIKE